MNTLLLPYFISYYLQLISSTTTTPKCTFRSVLLTTTLFDNVISEDEYLIPYDLNRSKNLDLLYDEFKRFDLDEMEDSECVAKFRVHKHSLLALAEALQISWGSSGADNVQSSIVWKDCACFFGDLHTHVDIRT